VLASDPKDVKALFRRGKAQLRLGNTDGAAADLDAAHRLAPDDAGIARELKVGFWSLLSANAIYDDV